MTSLIMKQEFAIIYVIFALGMMIMTVQIWKRKDEKASWMKRLFLLATATVIIYAISLFSNEKLVIESINTLVFVSEGWLLYTYYGLCLCFTQEGETKKKSFPKWIGILFVVDTIQMLVGLHFRWSMSYDFVEKNTNLYAHMVPGVGFICHLVLCYVVATMTSYLLMKKANEVASPYAMAYIGIMVGLIFLVVLNAGFLYKNWDLDVSILLYAFLAVVLDSYLYYFMQHAVRRHMKNYVVDNIEAPLLFFDMGDHLQILNEQAEGILEAEMGMELSEYIKDNHIESCFPDHSGQRTNRTFSMVQDYGSQIYLMQGKELCDNLGRFVGTLFVYYDITREERMKDEATYNATHDKLTGLWNREFFFEMSRQVLRENPDTVFYMVATNIENFKMFNAILGKKTGDELLIAIADCCRKNFTNNRLFGRISADRFAILIPKEGFNEGRFLRCENEVFINKGFTLNIKNYNGLCEISYGGTDPEIAYDWACMALQSIKGNVKENFAYFDEGLKKDMIDEALTADDLMQAIKEHQFVMFLQPQIDSVTGEIVGAEALARWESPSRGMVSPGIFIPIFEENGLITYLDYYIWEQACMMLRKWQDEGKTERSISINISAKDFYLSDLYESITGLVRKYGIDPARLKLEITETAIVLDLEEQMALVNRFQEFGFFIEMDDFGSGYSSLNSLKNIEVDILKLDMNFLGKATDRRRSEMIIKCMVELSQSLGMPVIAEGVETKEQLDFLQSIGCNIIQGFYYSKPMPIPEFEEFMAERKCVDVSRYIERSKKGNYFD